MQIPPSFIGTVMGYATFGLADLTWDPLKLSGQVGTGNLNVDYGNPLINASIARVGPNAGAQAKLQANYTPTGDAHGAKIVSMHTDKDGLVLVENEKEYADLAAPGLFTTGRRGRSHANALRLHSGRDHPYRPDLRDSRHGRARPSAVRARDLAHWGGPAW